MRVVLAWPIPTRHGAGVMRVLQRWINQRCWFVDLHAMHSGNVLERDHVHRLRKWHVQWIRSVDVHGVRAGILFQFARRQSVHGMRGGESATKERVCLLRAVRSGALSGNDGPDELRGVPRGRVQRGRGQYVLQSMRSWPLPELNRPKEVRGLLSWTIWAQHGAEEVLSMHRRMERK